MNRFSGFDYLRALGMFAVVYIHGSDTHPITKYGMKWTVFAVPCFFMISSFLAQSSILGKKDITFGKAVVGRLGRLAPAFCFWSAIYAVIRFGKASLLGVPVDMSLLGVMFWGDASHQLYFVPLLFYFFLVWTPLMLAARQHAVVVSVLCIVSAIAAVLFADRIAEWVPAKRWFIGINLAWFPIGMVVAIAANRVGDRVKNALMPLLVALAASIIAGVVDVYLCSVLMFLTAVAYRSNETPTWVSFLAKYSFGVYLVHVLIIETIQFAAPRIGVNTQSLVFACGVIGVAYVLSYIVCWAMSQSKYTQFAVQ